MYLKPWTMLVEYENSKSTIPLFARCPQSAVAMMAKEIAGRCVSDKRIAVGKITILDPENKEVYIIPEAGSKLKAGFIGDYLPAEKEVTKYRKKGGE